MRPDADIGLKFFHVLLVSYSIGFIIVAIVKYVAGLRRALVAVGIGLVAIFGFLAIGHWPIETQAAWFALRNLVTVFAAYAVVWIASGLLAVLIATVAERFLRRPKGN